MVTIVVMGHAIYITSQRFLFKGKQEALGDATRTIFIAVNLLVGLFLSLSLNDLSDGLSDIRYAVEREAAAISDVHNGLKHFGTAEADDIQLQLIEYTKAVIDDEWLTLAEHRLSDKAGTLLREIVSSVLRLQTNNQIEISSWNRISEDIDSISDYRHMRLHHALNPPPFFLLVVIFGIVVVMVCLGLYPLSRPLIILVSFYLSFVGLVVYLILALNNPFHGAPGVDTAPLTYVLEEMQKAHQPVP
jgi:hypothetical protein